MSDEPLSREAQLLLLVIAAAGGEMSRERAEDEFRRVSQLSREAFKRWVVLAQMRAHYWYLRKKADGS